MKNKLWISWVLGIFLVGLLTAGALTFSLIPASFTPEPIVQTRYEGNITFLCDGKPMKVYLNEPNMNIDDKFEMAVKNLCPNKVVSGVSDWTGRQYKKSELTNARSFDEATLKVSDCQSSGEVYDATGNKCINATITAEEPKQIEG